MPRPFINLQDQRFGLLTVRRRVPTRNKHDTYWLCLCDCGNKVIKKGGYLRSNAKLGFRASCGCLKRAGLRLRHGHQRKNRTTRTYKTWASMLARCRNPRETVWRYYGGRGICVCPQWQSFEQFLADMGERPGAGKEYTLDRIDVNGNYTPTNCRWATPRQQTLNRRRPA